MDKLEAGAVALVIVKVGFSNGEHRSFSRINKVSKDLEYKNTLLSEVEFYYNNYYDNYVSYSVESISILSNVLSPIHSSLTPNPLHSVEGESYKVGRLHPDNLLISNIVITIHNSLPSTMDLTLWNKLIIFNLAHTHAYFTLKDIHYTFELSDSSYICTITNLKNKNILLSFKDEMMPDRTLTNFKRSFLKDGKEYKIFIYKEGVIVKRKEILKTRFIGITPY